MQTLYFNLQVARKNLQLALHDPNLSALQQGTRHRRNFFWVSCCSKYFIKLNCLKILMHGQDCRLINKLWVQAGNACWSRISVNFRHLQVVSWPRIPTSDGHGQMWCCYLKKERQNPTAEQGWALGGTEEPCPPPSFWKQENVPFLNCSNSLIIHK